MAVYEKSVQELMKDFASEVRGVFRFADLRQWFRENYPSIQESTLRAHLHAMTLGAKQDWHQLPQIFERVGRGLYIPAREHRARSTSTPGPAAPPSGTPSVAEVRDRARQASSPDIGHRDGTTSADVVLVGCVKTKAGEPAPAQDLYISDLFLKRRRYAEGQGLPWYILSAEHGLLRPTMLVEPYDVELKAQPSTYRKAWGAWVVARLQRELGSLADMVFEVHAGDAYVEALREPMRAAGASLSRPLQGLSQGEQLAWYPAQSVSHTPNEVSAPRIPAEPTTSTVEADVAAFVQHLGDGGLAMPLDKVEPSDVDARPGLYAWFVDVPGARDLTRGLGEVVPPGLVYAGQAGATRWPSGRRSTNTLRARLIEMHRDGAVTMSTFRLTLAAILGLLRPGSEADEGALSQWMHEHLSVSWKGVTDPDDLGTLERAVLAQLEPPFNLRGMPPTTVRRKLSGLRSRSERPARSADIHPHHADVGP